MRRGFLFNLEFMKRKSIVILVVTLVVVTISFAGWKLYGPAVSTPEGEFLYIKTGATLDDVENELLDKGFIDGSKWYGFAVKILRYKNVKPGRYKVTKGMSLIKLVRMLRAGDQQKVNLVITKLRLPESLAAKVAASFECDSATFMAYISNNDTLQKFGLNTNTVMAAVMPYTYSLNWNSSADKIFREIEAAYRKFWNAERKAKADSIHLTPLQVSALASIVEEETRVREDKYKIASTYLNRIRTSMKLQADPTVKFAMKDFTIKRVLGIHLKTDSPYNTYMYAGIPPGPICTPSVESLDAVLDAPKTEYLYFVASSKFDGSSVFTTNYSDHLKYAKEYQRELTRRMDSVKKAKAATPQP